VSTPEIFGWFPQQNRDGLARLIDKYQVETALEIGTFIGLSAGWLATRVKYLWCVDPFEETETEPTENNLVGTLRAGGYPNPYFNLFRDNMIAAGVWSKIHPIRGRSQDVVERAPVVDLVYIDGDHSYEGCARDIRLYLPKARKVICGDDHHSAPDGVPYFPGVVCAVREAFPQYKADYSFWWKEL
jgi:hypothetical protein